MLPFMKMDYPKEGDAFWTRETGRAIYAFTNHSLRRVPDWGTYLKMKLPDTKGLSHRLFSLIPIGPDLPSLA